MKKICVITATRSEYGLLKWIMHDLAQRKDIILQIIATGAHLSPEYGMTYHFIEDDGFVIDRKVEYQISSQTAEGIAKSMGVCGISMSDALSSLTPDIIVVLGDRYELLPICSTALILGIPIAHISGGDVTEGAIDNQIRNAITMLSDIHFPGTLSSKENISRMIGSDKNVFDVGETNIDNFIRNTLVNRKELAKSLNLKNDRHWVLATLHPETKQNREYNISMTHAMLKVLSKIPNTEIIITQSNSDLFGCEMNKILEESSKKYLHFHFITTLGTLKYTSILKELWFMIGNSSSGIVEAPFVGTPVINIGNRQKGRHLCKNIIQTGITENDINQGIERAIIYPRTPDYYYGDGKSSSRIVKHLISFLKET